MEADLSTMDLDRALLDLRHIIGFESAQLLRFGSAGAVEEVFRFGYGKRTAWALANLFPRSYETGFTTRASRDAPLPATISTSTDAFHDEFVATTIYRDHLLREGYLDGMSVELTAGGRSIGLAHFSSRTRNAFVGDVRSAMLSMSGVLAHVVARHDVRSALPLGSRSTPRAVVQTGWFDVATSRWTATLPAAFGHLQTDADFLRHLGYVAGLPTESLTHLWPTGRNMVEVRLRHIAESTLVSVAVSEVSSDAYFHLTSQELQVLSCLCCGLADVDIAERLHISPRTVHAHMSSLRQKMHAASRVELAIIALGDGLFVPHPTLSPIGRIVRTRST